MIVLTRCKIVTHDKLYIHSSLINMSFDKSLDSQEKKKRTSLAEQPVKTETCVGVLQQPHQIIGCVKVMTYYVQTKTMLSFLTGKVIVILWVVRLYVEIIHEL